MAVWGLIALSCLIMARERYRFNYDFTPDEDLLIIDLGSFDVDVEALGLAGSGLVSE